VRKNKAFKLAAGILSTALFLSIPTAITRADSFISVEQGVAGISAILANTTDQDLEDAYQSSIKSLSTEKKSPYENLGVSIASDYVNIRRKASTDSKVAGKLYRGCATDILDRLDGGWVKIKSGKVEGYIASEFLAIGDKAETMVDKYATKYATITNQTVRVRDKKSKDSAILTLVPGGETYVVNKEYDDWVQIIYGSDDESNKELTGYVSKECANVSVEFKYAISIEEENKIKKAQEEALKAEMERKVRLAQEEAEKKERARRQAASRSSNSDRGSTNISKDTPTLPNSSEGSSRRQQVVNYALKFVGNRYVWGGQSLTGGADCSGFVRAIYADFGYSLPRTSSEQSSAGTRVSVSEMQPGDLIFYAYSGGRIHHVAMYIGNGRIVHAASSRQGIITSQYNYNEVYCVRRIMR
jgi:Cell wall-associated hydrolases (invasion-associated proteins)